MFFKSLPEQPKISFQELESSVAETISNYTIDEASDLVVYGVQTSKVTGDILRSGAINGCHLVIGLISDDESFMAHNEGSVIAENPETINKIKDNPSGSYYFFFTKRSFTLMYESPADYLQAMEESYGVRFKKAFYYDETKSPLKSWVEASYNHKTRSLDVAGFEMKWTGGVIQHIKHACPSITLNAAPTPTRVLHR